MLIFLSFIVLFFMLACRVFQYNKNPGNGGGVTGIMKGDL
jgi:succinate-acetate transporter protein